ncbi:MAG: hypothetical protein HY243_07700 [Proteobacteria bacterium]|nr:hypothetical protein [Pseudomonadota bacterium]
MPNWSLEAAKRAIDLLALNGPNADVAAYWLALWKGKCAPLRASFSLKDLGENAPAAAIFALVGEDWIACQEAGGFFQVGLGIDPTGHNLLRLTPPGERQARVERATQIVEGSVMRGRRIFGTESGSVQAEEIYLPFADVGRCGERYYLMHSNWRPSGRL